MWTGSPRVCCAPDTLRGASSDLFPRAGTSVAQRQPWRAALRLEEVPKKSPSSLDAGPSAPAATSHVPQGRWRLRTRPHSPPGAHAPLWLLADAAVGGGAPALGGGASAQRGHSGAALPASGPRGRCQHMSRNPAPSPPPWDLVRGRGQVAAVSLRLAPLQGGGGGVPGVGRTK